MNKSPKYCAPQQSNLHMISLLWECICFCFFSKCGFGKQSSYMVVHEGLWEEWVGEGDSSRING